MLHEGTTVYGMIFNDRAMGLATPDGAWETRVMQSRLMGHIEVSMRTSL